MLEAFTKASPGLLLHTFSSLDNTERRSLNLVRTSGGKIKTCMHRVQLGGIFFFFFFFFGGGVGGGGGGGVGYTFLQHYKISYVTFDL